MIRSRTELDSEARDLLAQLDATYAPSPADRARVRDRVLQSLAGVPLGALPAGHEQLEPVADAVRGGASGYGLGLGAKALLGAVVVGGACFGAGFLAGRHSAPTVVHPPSPAPVLAPARPGPAEAHPPLTTSAALPEKAPAANTADARPAPKVSSGRAPARSPEPVAPPTDPSSDGPLEVHTSALWQETQLLQRAQRALGSGNAQLSQALLDELAEEFPQGVLIEERTAVRILTECALGRVAEARAQASRFEAAYPQSVHAERVRGSCAGTPPSEGER